MKELTIYHRLEMWTSYIIMAVLSWTLLSTSLYITKQSTNIHKDITEEELINTTIEFTPISFNGMDEDGDIVVRHLTLPRGFFSWFIPLNCLLVAIFCLLKSYTYFLCAVEGQEKQILKFFAVIDRFLEKMESLILLMALGTMLMIYLIQIILQNLAPTWLSAIQGGAWMTQVSTLMVGVVGFFGASLALRSRRHIKVDLVSKLVSIRTMRQITAIMDNVGFVVTIVFAVLGMEYINFLRHDGAFITKLSAGVGDAAYFISIPDWPFKIFIPVAFGILAFRFLKGMVDGLLTTKRMHS